MVFQIFLSQVRFLNIIGSNFGTDWSHIADIILPHPYLYHEVKVEFKYQTVTEIYKLAEGMTKKLGLGSLGKQFWSKSNFNFSSCGPHIFSHCTKAFTEIITCKKLGWPEYFNIHETALNIALRNQEYSSLARRDMRFSAVDEALQNLGSIIAIDNLPVYDFIPENAFKEENDIYNRRNTVLLLLALRILPKLPFYLLSDDWRLAELEFSYGNFTENWWKKRIEVQGVHGFTNLEPDFLGDSYITSNRPYLSKYLGLFLQFQFLDHFQRYFSTENGTIADYIHQDDNFLEFINDRPNKKWSDLLSYYYAIDEISSSTLLDYFKPLEEYLDTAPLNQVTYSITEKPRTTKPITKPSSKRTKPTQKIKNIRVNQTESVQNDATLQPTESPKSSTTVNTASSSGQIGLIIGIIGVIMVGIILIVVVQKLKKRRKKKTNNRRFET